MSTVTCQKASAPTEADNHFYERYAWCLNPLQTVDQLFVRLEDELKSYPHLGIGWQQQESRVNLFLLTCAISCASSDYLAPSLPSFPQLASRWHRARFAIWMMGKTLSTAFRLRSFLVDHPVYCWNEEWNGCVDLACDILLNQRGADSPQLAQLLSMSRDLAGRTLPKMLLSKRMQLPSAFRAQDLTHHDVFTLADVFARSHQKQEGVLGIVGIRTAGAYFAPLLHARLQQDGWKSTWISIRPKGGVSWWEKKVLCALAERNARVLVVDDHPATGETIRLTIDLLCNFGIDRQNITAIVPGHEAQRDVSVLTGGCPDVELVTISAQDSYKHRLTADDTLKPLLEQFLSTQYHGRVLFIDDEETKAINRRLEAHLHDDFQVHVKRVYALRTSPTGEIRRVLVKSVGWGWLGYHAYLTGTRLQEFVPNVLGLRDGMLFSEWIDAQPDGSKSNKRACPARIAAYVAARVERLSLAEYTSANQAVLNADGLYTLTKVLRGVYPQIVRLLKMYAITSSLKAYTTRQPTFIDGKMGADEWVSDGKKFLKIDYEHHGFGNPSPNIVDAAYDLALAALQLNLSQEAQEQLLVEYVRLTGDSGVRERFVLHALVCGHLAGESARFHSAQALTNESRKQFETLNNHARDFLTNSLTKFCAEHFAQPKPAHWLNRLFYMDIDGVFDRSYFYFSHTTASGIAALASLNRNGYSVVLNTGRPVAHVRQYCSTYAISGGIAEYGCVFVDAINKRETLLIEDCSREQLAQLRTRLKDESGIFLDDTYEVAIRAYQLEDNRVVCLPQALIVAALQDFPNLTFFSSPIDTYIFPVEAGKGSATRKVMEQLSVPREATAAIGDSEMDLPMLDMVAKAYVPGNASNAMIHQARHQGVTVLLAPFQRGLLQAVNNLLKDQQSNSQCSPANGSLSGPAHPEHIVKTLLQIADRTTAQHWMTLLKPNRL
jgi:hydroxymethylpyrimidine pyrophosphatase-like HAD family hydrolase/adenine/guanine phosphoribosyltransferase-like PRPP-binding protein